MLVFPTLTASAGCSKPAAAGRWARQRYFEQVRRLVAEVAEAEITLRQGEERLQGWLRVAASTADVTDVQNRGRSLAIIGQGIGISNTPQAESASPESLAATYSGVHQNSGKPNLPN